LLLGHAPLDDAYADGIIRLVIDGIRSRRAPAARASAVAKASPLS
jgi:hypothetical protein